jgi:hypothetical protein
MCEDYRAAASIDLEDHRESRNQGKRVIARCWFYGEPKARSAAGTALWIFGDNTNLVRSAADR